MSQVKIWIEHGYAIIFLLITLISFFSFTVYAANSAPNSQPQKKRVVINEETPPEEVRAAGELYESKVSEEVWNHKALKESYLQKPAENKLKIIETFNPETKNLGKERVFIHFTEKPTEAELEEIEKTGAIVYKDSWLPPVGKHPTGFYLADVPLESLGKLENVSFISKVNTAERQYYPTNNLGASSINADDLWSTGGGYTGSGVAVAVLDSGLDVDHSDIPTPTASRDYSGYPTLDDTIANSVTTHGTHVTGSVLGRGTNSSGTYKGMGYAANLVFLKIGNDTTAGASSDAIVYAMRAAVDTYSADIVTMSYGGWGRYQDGSAEEDQAVDYAYNQGAVVFIAAGNEGSAGEHYSGTVAASSSTGYIRVDVTGAGIYVALYYNLVWFDDLGVNNALDLSFYDSSYVLQDRTVYLSQSESTRGTESETAYYDYYLPSGSSTWYLRVTNSSSKSQKFHLYYSTAFNASSYTSVAFNSADAEYTLGTPATADRAIAVGAYVSRASWTNYLGSSYTYGQTLNNMATFSSRGPRVDEEFKPEIASPGSAIISVKDSDLTGECTATYTIDNDGVFGGSATYCVMQGTSMATPIAAGAASQLMQAYPSYSNTKIKNLILAGADNSLGHASTDGYGYLNILNSYNIGATTLYNDVDIGHLYYLYIRYNNINSIATGYGDNTYRPDNYVTRCQLSKFVVNGFLITLDTSGTAFTDVTSGHIFFDYVQTLKNNNVISGYGDGSFHCDSYVNRAQAAKFIVNGSRAADQTTLPDTSDSDNRFSDVPNTDVFEEYIETLFDQRIISGYGTYPSREYRPTNNLTRGQMAKIIHRTAVSQNLR